MKSKTTFIVITNHEISIEFSFIYSLIMLRYAKKMKKFEYHSRRNTNHRYQDS